MIVSELNEKSPSASFRLVAIAKDEASYIADWIHHHLYFGFDQIHVYVNRTTDNTIAILKEITKKYTGVSFEVVDWIDLCPPRVNSALQKICYAKDLDYARRNNIDYIMFLDIDEFWVPNDFSTRIKEFVQPRVDAFAFNWHCELAQDTPFSPLAENGYYYVHKLCKTLFKTGLNIKTLRVHYPEFGGNVICRDADGNKVKMAENNEQTFIDDLCYPKSAFVVHRMYRSKEEYMATLSRGRPSQKGKLKDNRPGFFAPGMLDNEFITSFPKEHYENYIHSCSHFNRFCNIEQLIIDSKNSTLEKSAEVKAYIENNINDEVVIKVSKNLFSQAL